MLSNILKTFNITIPYQIENIGEMEKIFNSVTSLSDKLKVFDEVKHSFVQMSTNIPEVINKN
jgi:hypothetical protein